MLSRFSFVFLLILVTAAIYLTPGVWLCFCRRGSIERSRKLATVKYSVHLRQTRCSLLKELLSQGCVTAVVPPFCGQPWWLVLRELVSAAAYTITQTSKCCNLLIKVSGISSLICLSLVIPCLAMWRSFQLVNNVYINIIHIINIRQYNVIDASQVHYVTSLIMTSLNCSLSKEFS